MSDRKTNGEILKAIHSVDSKLGILINKMKTVESTISKYEKIIYGNPEKMGEGGLIHATQLQDSQIKGLSKSIDHTRSTFVMIWTGIFALVQVAFSAIRHIFTEGN